MKARLRPTASRLAALAASLLAAPAFAQVPQDTTFTGRLVDNLGDPLAGPVSLELRVFDADAGGTQLYSEQHLGVALDATGGFSVQLGLGTGPSGTFDADLFSDPNRWLEVVVGVEVLAPRQAIGSVPWALIAQQANETLGVVPVGSIVAWHPDLFVGGASLPPEWAPCDGQILNDSESPLDGVQLPDLNGERRFLRGDATSGAIEDDQLQSHQHSYSTRILFNGEHVPGVSSYSGPDNLGNGRHDDFTGEPVESSAGPVRRGDETRPRNMSVRWIIRVR